MSATSSANASPARVTTAADPVSPVSSISSALELFPLESAAAPHSPSSLSGESNDDSFEAEILQSMRELAATRKPSTSVTSGAVSAAPASPSHVTAAAQQGGVNEKPSPELPDNWEALALEDGRTYYWHVETGETTWERPHRSNASQPAGGLPLPSVPASSEASVMMQLDDALDVDDGEEGGDEDEGDDGTVDEAATESSEVSTAQSPAALARAGTESAPGLRTVPTSQCEEITHVSAAGTLVVPSPRSTGADPNSMDAYKAVREQQIAIDAAANQLEQEREAHAQRVARLNIRDAELRARESAQRAAIAQVEALKREQVALGSAYMGVGGTHGRACVRSRGRAPARHSAWRRVGGIVKRDADRSCRERRAFN